MHRLASSQIVFRFRLTAFLLWIRNLLIIATLCMIGYAFTTFKNEHLMIMIGMIVFCAITSAYYFLLSKKTKCPLCMMPPMASLRCSRNRQVKKQLGSYSLKVASSILTTNKFRCQYCGEATEIAVRQPRQR